MESAVLGPVFESAHLVTPKRSLTFNSLKLKCAHDLTHINY